MNELTNQLLLLSGFAFSFFIPGFLLIETFFSKLPKIQKIPLYMILSVEVSTVVWYVAGYIFGLNRATIIFSMLPFLIWLGIFIAKRGVPKIFSKTSLLVFLGSVAIYTIFLTALSPAIFSPRGDYFVMGANNWQDTAMHTSIIESITQGNFPPQAPYFSGRSLDYYYFVDFHSSLLNILYGNFFPRILVFDNPFFVMMFFAAVFALSYSLTKSRAVSWVSSILATFYGNFMFTRFLTDVAGGGRPLQLLANDGYAMEFSGIFQVTPMVDYFLQNRPMMFGLPAFAINAFLIFEGFRKKDLKRILLSGIIIGLSIKFQLFSALASLIAFGIGMIVFMGKKRLKFLFKSFFVFALPIGYLTLFSLFMFPGQSSILSTFKETFHWGPWEKQDILWHLRFILANFGAGIPLGLAGTAYLFINRKVTKKWFLFVLLLFLVLFAFPYAMSFTIFNRDMFKFFYVGTILLAILAGFFAVKLFRSGLVGKILSVLIVISLTFTSVLVLIWSHESKTGGYSMSDYTAGKWIRSNTPQKSVFIGYPTVHSPATDIGGRLRVTSYINWPYSHGFNSGRDNVFTRVADIEAFYKGIKGRDVLDKYNVSYVYFGPEEMNRYPEAQDFLTGAGYLKIRYNSGDIKIYEVQN